MKKTQTTKHHTQAQKLHGNQASKGCCCDRKFNPT